MLCRIADETRQGRAAATLSAHVRPTFRSFQTFRLETNAYKSIYSPYHIPVTVHIFFHVVSSRHSKSFPFPPSPPSRSFRACSVLSRSQPAAGRSRLQLAQGRRHSCGRRSDGCGRRAVTADVQPACSAVSCGGGG